MKKCQTCKTNAAEIAWQPFGPSESADCFVRLGSHYRGFTVVAICGECEDRLHDHAELPFTIKGHNFIGSAEEVRAA